MSGTTPMMEAHKSTRRRWNEDAAGAFPWRKILSTGIGLDVGAKQYDKIPLDNFQGFDLEQGDANRLSSYFPAETFDCIHGSHVLQLMENPESALRDWFALLKPGGWMVQTVPDWGAYERFRWPSSLNPGHKSSWSMVYRGSLAPIHVFIPEFLQRFADMATIERSQYVENNYDWKLDPNVDQTLNEETGVECWNEFVLHKK